MKEEDWRKEGSGRKERKQEERKEVELERAGWRKKEGLEGSRINGSCPRRRYSKKWAVDISCIA